jgi:general secretion pathway protein G
VRRTAQGFTLIELLVTVAIVGVLAATALPFAEVAMQRGKEAELRAALRTLRDGIDAYKRAADEGRVARKADESGYPRSLEDLVAGVQDAKSPDRRRIYFLRRIPRDPFAAQPGGSAASTWGLRSHASPHDAPAPGDDVFDVYSLSPRTGLNGVPYREW